MHALLYVALGGALGSVLRYVTVLQVQARTSSHLPLGTLTVNLIGSFLIGLVWSLIERYAGDGSWHLPLIMVGILGGFTTFSSFSIENMKLIQEGEWLNMAIYVLSSNVLGIFLAFTGYQMGRMV